MVASNQHPGGTSWDSEKSEFILFVDTLATLTEVKGGWRIMGRGLGIHCLRLVNQMAWSICAECYKSYTLFFLKTHQWCAIHSTKTWSPQYINLKQRQIRKSGSNYIAHSIQTLIGARIWCGRRGQHMHLIIGFTRIRWTMKTTSLPLSSSWSGHFHWV